jgi:hypothetical protein
MAAIWLVSSLVAASVFLGADPVLAWDIDSVGLLKGSMPKRACLVIFHFQCHLSSLGKRSWPGGSTLMLPLLQDWTFAKTRSIGGSGYHFRVARSNRSFGKNLFDLE